MRFLLVLGKSTLQILHIVSTIVSRCVCVCVGMCQLPFLHKRVAKILNVFNIELNISRRRAQGKSSVTVLLQIASKLGIGLDHNMG